MLNANQIHALRCILDKSNIVQKAWLFGSYSRNQEKDTSDIDIMFETIPGVRFGLIKQMSIIVEMEDKLGIKVDFIYAPSMLPEVKEEAEKDKILLYERQ